MSATTARPAWAVETSTAYGSDGKTRLPGSHRGPDTIVGTTPEGEEIGVHVEQWSAESVAEFDWMHSAPFVCVRSSVVGHQLTLPPDLARTFARALLTAADDAEEAGP